MTLFDQIKAKFVGRDANSGSTQSYQSKMATLVGVQLSNLFGKPSKAFPVLMRNTKAAGYLFGFHLTCAKNIYGTNADICLAEIETSYLELFGKSAGRTLFLQTDIDRENPDFQSGMLQADFEMCDLDATGAPPSGLKRLLFPELDLRQVDPSMNALSKFEKVISTWDPEQARVALAVLSEIALGAHGPLESIYGKGAKWQEVIRHLQVGHVRVLWSTIEEITRESYIRDFDSVRAKLYNLFRANVDTIKCENAYGIMMQRNSIYSSLAPFAYGLIVLKKSTDDLDFTNSEEHKNLSIAIRNRMTKSRVEFSNSIFDTINSIHEEDGNKYRFEADHEDIAKQVANELHVVLDAISEDSTSNEVNIAVMNLVEVLLDSAPYYRETANRTKALTAFTEFAEHYVY